MNGQQPGSSKPNNTRILAAVLIIAGAALCLGVYFGLFIGMRVFGGGG